MKKKILPLFMVCVLGCSIIAGCAKATKSADTKSQNRSKNNGSAAAAATEANYELAGETVDYYYDDEASLDMSYEEADYKYAENGANAAPGADPNSVDVKADASKEMLVFRCNMSIDTLNFEEALTALKMKIEEYHGFIERENQSDGNSSNGRYVLDENDKDYYYTATIRIPSAYYESFVSAASGIGTLRSKNSSVDNVATRYGTLANELEIFEAEYDRYLKQYNETEDEAIALQIQYELRNLAITISDIKTEMSMLESDVAYSYVTITIHKVSEKEIKKEEKEVKEEDTFGTKLSKTAKGSWEGFLGFLQGIVLFFVANWWIFLLLLIIGGAIILSIRRGIKKAKRKAEARRKELEAEQFERMKAFQMAKEQSAAANQAQIQARIASQRAAEQAKAAAEQKAKEEAEQAKKEAEQAKEEPATSSETVNTDADAKEEGKEEDK